jgi:hypothetical protein
MAERARGATDVDGRKSANASGVRQRGSQTRVPLTRCAPGLMHPRVPASPPAAVANTAASPPQRQVGTGRRAKKLKVTKVTLPEALFAPAPAAAAPALARKACGTERTRPPSTRALFLLTCLNFPSLKCNVFEHICS